MYLTHSVSVAEYFASRAIFIKTKKTYKGGPEMIVVVLGSTKGMGQLVCVHGIGLDEE